MRTSREGDFTSHFVHQRVRMHSYVVKRDDSGVCVSLIVKGVSYAGVRGMHVFLPTRFLIEDLEPLGMSPQLRGASYIDHGGDVSEPPDSSLRSIG